MSWGSSWVSPGVADWKVGAEDLERALDDRAGSEASAAPTEERAPSAGSTKLTAGSVPAAQSRKNLSIGAWWSVCLSTIDGITAVIGTSVK